MRRVFAGFSGLGFRVSGSRDLGFMWGLGRAGFRFWGLRDLVSTFPS